MNCLSAQRIKCIPLITNDFMDGKWIAERFLCIYAFLCIHIHVWETEQRDVYTQDCDIALIKIDGGDQLFIIF